MSWAEYQIRVIGYRRKLKNEQEFDMLMAREIAYEVHKLGFMIGKKQPSKKNVWWPIGDKKSGTVTEEARKAFLIAHEKAQQKLNQKKDG